MSDKPRTVVLFDGMALLYRAFYAIPDLSTASGEPTNAVYGFVRMVSQVLDSFKPTHGAVVFDGGLSKEKIALLSEYKAQRPPMPDALRSQVPKVEEYLDCARIARIRVAGEEADDVIASLANWAEEGRDKIFLATNDKDLFQLVNSTTFIVPMPPSAKAVLGPEEVRTKTGVLPAQIPEWLALTGDSSDNIPGVPGVGAKTAAKLLEQFGSIEAVLSGLSGLKAEKLRATLSQSRDIILRNVKMTSLRRDMECGVGWDDLVIRGEPSAKLVPFLERMEFHSMAKAASSRSRDLFPSV